MSSVFGGVEIVMGFCDMQKSPGLDLRFQPQHRSATIDDLELSFITLRPVPSIFRPADADHATERYLSVRVESYGRLSVITLDLQIS